MKRFVNVSRGTRDQLRLDLSLQMKASYAGLTYKQLNRVIVSSILACVCKSLVWKPSQYPMLFQ